jgi:NAD(P)-dependent dehydrogenase (short-subunit alcohol dehydrogenase family)
MGRLERKVAVITGGASGMGAATVRRFVREGASVVIADVLEPQAEKLVGELGRSCLFAHADVTREEDVKGAIDTAVRAFGRLDCVFNNAGAGGVDGPIEEIDAQGWDDTMALLVKGVFLGIKHAAPIMKERRSGSIINTASIAGLRTGMGPLCYSAAKAAVAHLSRCAAAELGEWNVRVNAICPGGIVTPIFGKALGLSVEEAERNLESVTELLAQMQPIPRPGQPDDIASAALFLASDESSFVNGHALVVDGGLIGGRGYSETQDSWEQFAEMLGAPPRSWPRAPSREPPEGD